MKTKNTKKVYLKTESGKSDPKSVFGNIAFGSDPEISKLQGKTEYEKDTRDEKMILSNLLQWLSISTGKAADTLYKSINLFKNAKIKFPSIFKPNTPNGTEVYRGISTINDVMISNLQQKSTIKDYTKVKLAGKVFYKYNKPVSYEPYNNVQSWTTNLKVAKEFAGATRSAVLISKQNDEYFFNQKFMNRLLIRKVTNPNVKITLEDEILHFGKNFSSPVFIALNLNVFKRNILRKDLLSKKPSTKFEVKSILTLLNIATETINPDLTVDIFGDVDISENYLTVIPLQFGEVDGNFDCSGTGLTSLVGAPQSVGGDFNCGSNKLTTLEGAPELVYGSFDCGDNKLTSLKGAPKKVGGDFWCSHNQLTSLKGSPRSISGDFHCSNNKLTSFEGAPKKIGGDFLCTNNKPPLNQSQIDWIKKNIKANSYQFEGGVF